MRRMRAFFSILPPGEFPHHAELAPLLARFAPRTSSSSAFGPSSPVSAQRPGSSE